MKNTQYYLVGMERRTIAAVVAAKSASLTECPRVPFCILLRKKMKDNPRIVFVCEHGAAKSIIAAAYFNKLAREKDLSLTAIARGTHPDAELSSKTVAGLHEEALTPTESVPQKLSLSDIESAQRVVSFCELPDEYEQKAVIEQWENVPPVSENYEKARDAILEYINRLIKELS